MRQPSDVLYLLLSVDPDRQRGHDIGSSSTRFRGYYFARALSSDRTGEVYSATKHGVVGLSRTAALNYGEYGIRVNVVCPGPIETPMIAQIPDELKRKAFKRIPLGRLGVPDEIAEPVVFLCSDRASYMTGAVITIDGGVTESTMRIVDD